ncbi:ankyrin 1 [Fusarium albosuccineum]|uniref:Ankyrin 1 n=1 Tax=Fusarium albosuccineum TaxID=1237068 RepID=A0A8H4PI71_9HYPO|nr:ankyrin 1 [Fusarium albosuccineum]
MGETNQALDDDHRLGLEEIPNDEAADNLSYDVVAIHGLQSRSRQAWAKHPGCSPYETWLHGKFDSLPRHSSRVLLYGYDVGAMRGTRGIYKEAEALLDALVEVRGPEVKAMDLATRHESKYADILYCIRTLVFCGYPHRYETRGFLEESILQLLIQLPSRPYKGDMTRVFQSLADATIELNDAFIHTRLLTQVNLVNVVSTYTNRAQKGFVLDPWMACMNIPFERQLKRDLENSRLSLQLQDEVHPLYGFSNNDWLGGNLPDHLGPVSHQLLDQASPIYPLMRNEKVESFPELDGLAASSEDRIIHLRCPSRSISAWVSERARIFLQSAKTTFQPMLYFKFDEHDVRFNNIQVMLQTFFARLFFDWLDNKEDDVEAVVKDIDHYRDMTPGRLFSHYQYVRMQDNWCDSIHVLGCFDQCDDSAIGFLDMLCEYVEKVESGLKVLIVTTRGTERDEMITNSLSRFPPDIVSSIEYEPSQPQACNAEDEISMLVQEYPQLTLGGYHQCIQAERKHDRDLCYLIVHWVKSNPEYTALLSDGPLTPGQVFTTILAGMPNDREAWARILLSWVLTSMRPLRVFEFNWISDDLSPARGESGRSGGEYAHVADILKYFGGLLVVTHGEIRFGHPGLRDWLLNQKDETWYRQSSEVERHALVAETCLAYLCDDEEEDQAVWVEQFPYAIEFWAHHYRCSTTTEDVTEGLFKEGRLLERWVEAYNALPTPFLKPLHHTKPLPVAAHFGLDDVVKFLVVFEVDKKIGSQALVEAARAGHLAVLRLIIESYPSVLDFDDEYLHEAVRAASVCGNPEGFRELVGSIPKPPYLIPMRDSTKQEPTTKEMGDDRGSQSSVFGNKANDDGGQKSQDEEIESEKPQDPFDWLGIPLLKAATYGLDDVIVQLLALGADPNPPKGTHLNDKTPLHRAASHSQLSSIKCLVDAGASLNATEANHDTPLFDAVFFGSGATVKTLLELGSTIDATRLDSRDVMCFMPLHVAAEEGRYAAMAAILQHRGYREYGGYKPLHYPLCLAAENERPKTLKILLHYGFDPNTPNDENETALLLAVKRKSINMCRALLDNGADPNLTPEGTVYPLIKSITENRLDIMKLLVEKGANIEKKEGWRRTPMQVAVDYKHADQAEYLLEKGANPNVHDSDKDWAIGVAVLKGLTSTVRKLAEAGADLNVSDSLKRTPLILAVKQPEIFELLFELGADVKRPGQNRWSPLDVAIIHGQAETIKFILNKSKVNIYLGENRTCFALAEAVKAGHLEAVAAMLEGGAFVDSFCRGGEALLFVAIKGPSVDMVRKILEFRPNLRIWNENGDSALHKITPETPVESMQLVANAGVRLDLVNNFKETVVQAAVLAQNEKVFKWLLTKKEVLSDLNKQPKKTRAQILHQACKVGSLEMVRLLIEHGVNVNYACSGVFGTPLISTTIRASNALGGSKMEILELLVEKRAKPNAPAGLFGYPIISASLVGDKDVVKFFLDLGVSIDVKDAFDRKPAHMACYTSLEALNLLNAPDSDFAARDAVGRVPLHYAVLSGEVELVREVLERSERAGVDINVRDDDGWTPLLWAARSSKRLFHEEDVNDPTTNVVSFLLEKGADPEVEAQGWSAATVAYYHGMNAIGDLIASRQESAAPRLEEGEKPKNGPLFCDCCLLEIKGGYSACKNCFDFALCFKCVGSKDKIHPKHWFGDEGEKPEPPKRVEEDVAEAEDENVEEAGLNGEEPELTKQVKEDAAAVSGVQANDGEKSDQSRPENGDDTAVSGAEGHDDEIKREIEGGAEWVVI